MLRCVIQHSLLFWRMRTLADEQSKWNRKPFRIHFAERELEDLRARIRSSRLPLIEMTAEGQARLRAAMEAYGVL